jgi:hypothetical protein
LDALAYQVHIKYKTMLNLEKILLGTTVNLFYNKRSQVITKWEEEDVTVPCLCRIVNVCSSDKEGINVVVLPLIEVKLFKDKSTQLINLLI